MDGNNFTDVTMGTSIATCGSNEKVIGRIYDFAVGGGERISNIDKTVNPSSNTIVLPSNNLVEMVLIYEHQQSLLVLQLPDYITLFFGNNVISEREIILFIQI